MRKKMLVLVSVLIALLVAVSPVSAVTYGEPDGSEHPYVGVIVFYDADMVPLWRCTGTLLSPDVVLTAGHCTDGARFAQVWFGATRADNAGYPFTGGVLGTPFTYPGWTGVLPNTGDVGLIALETSVTMSTFGELAQIGTLDAFLTRRGQNYPTFTVVGYGLQGVRPQTIAQVDRYAGQVELINLTSALNAGFNVQFTGNPGNGKGGEGGACFGDSGGPLFLGDTNQIVGVISFGMNANCKGTGFAYRVDTEAVYDWIDGFILGIDKTRHD